MGNFKDSDYYKSGRILENIKKGSILGSKKLIELKNKRIDEYNKKPKLCLFCNNKLEYKKRINKFCNSSCSASFNNKSGKPFEKILKECLNCKKEFLPKKENQKYCCFKCSCENKSENTKALWENVEYRNKVEESLRKAWFDKRDNFSCGEKHSKIMGKITKGKYKGEIKSIHDVSRRTIKKIFYRLKISCCICEWNEDICDIHHINGKKIDDYDNHNNLTYICPNCHRLVHSGKIEKNKLKTLNEILPENWVDFYYG